MLHRHMSDVNSWLTGSIFADPDHVSKGLSHGEPHLVENYNLDPMYRY